jgi:alpha-1,2-mannosyltransferase
MGAAHVLGPHLYNVRLAPLPLHFTYPPFAALLFWSFAQLPVHVGQLVWSLLNLVMLVALTAISIHACRPQWSHQRTWAIAIIVLFPVLRLSPDLLTFDFGQINFLIALLVLLDLTCVIAVRSHKLPRGVLLGIAAALKLTPPIFIAFLLLTRQFRAGATALGTFLFCSLGAFAITPHSWLVYWSSEIFNIKRPGNLLYMSDQNLHSALQRMISGPPPPVLLGSLTLLFAAGGLVVATWAYHMSSPMLGVLLCAATGLIISPVSWSHHYVWIVPLLAWLVLAADRPRGAPWWAAGVAALFWAAPIWWVPNRQRGYGGPLVLLAGNSYFLAAVAFLLLGGALLWTRHRRYPIARRNHDETRAASEAFDDGLPARQSPDQRASADSLENRRLILQWFESITCHQVKHQLRDALASLIRFRPMQPDATGSGRMPLVVGYTWDGFRSVCPGREVCTGLRRDRSATPSRARHAARSAASMRLLATAWPSSRHLA